MNVEPSLLPQWISACIDAVDRLFNRIKTAVLRAFGYLEQDTPKKEPINASKHEKNPIIDAVRDKHISSPSKPKSVYKSDALSDAELAHFKKETADANKDLAQHEKVAIVEPAQLEQDTPKKEPINASKHEKNPIIDAVRDKHISSPSKPKSIYKSDALSDAELAHFEKETADANKDLAQHEKVAIVEPAQTVRSYGESIYRTALDPKFNSAKDRAAFEPIRIKNENYRKRLSTIAKHFNSDTVYPVRGDGNCFCNAAVAGLIIYLIKNPQMKSSIMAKIERDLSSDVPYITPDTSNNALKYGTEFSKNNDFKEVLEKLKNPITPQLLNDFDFTSKFSRVIKYMLLIENEVKDAESRRFGNEMEATFIYALYRVFKINVKLAILENRNQLVDPKDPTEFGFTDPLEEIERRVNNNADFVIVLKSAHYFALVNSSL